MWNCPFCMNRNHFPPHYAENISEVNLPAELIPQYTTVEYELQSQLPGRASLPPSLGLAFPAASLSHNGQPSPPPSHPRSADLIERLSAERVGVVAWDPPRWSSSSAGPPVFLLLVDTCLDDEELDHLKSSLQQVLNLLPEQALIGLVTFGTHVMVHELVSSDCSRSYVFRGTKEYTPQVGRSVGGQAGQRSAVVGRGHGLGT